jgi:intracellular sulfur oxidation DsrE/DsrF family protein
MNGNESQSPLARRSFLTQLGTGATVIGAAVAGTPAHATQTASEASWQPVRHSQDDWWDKIPGQHRFVFDTTSPEGLASGLQFANNFFEANKSGYGLQDSDLAVVMIVRHKSTAFGYNDAMWAKYGTQLSTQANNFTDPKTKQPAVINVYATAGTGDGPGGRMNTLIKKGMHLAICQMATRAIAGSIARATGGETDAIFNELVANIVPNAHMVPAGIVAVNRGQERGYSFVVAV